MLSTSILYKIYCKFFRLVSAIQVKEGFFLCFCFLAQ